MYEYGALHDASGKDVTGGQDVETVRAVPATYRQVMADHRRGQRRRRVHQRAVWVYLLLLSLLGMALLSGCNAPGYSSTLGAQSPTATATAMATAPATAPASDTPSAVFIAENSLSGSQSRVLALNPINGAVLWRSKTFTGTIGSLFQSQGIVLAPINSISVVSLVALNAQDGTERWHTSALYPSATVLVNGNTAYISGQADSAHHGIVGAYRITDGILLWRYDAGNCGAEFLAAASGEVVLSPGGCSNPQVTALNEHNGAVLWQRPAKDIGAKVTIANGVVYLNNFGLVTAFDAGTGATKWQYTPAQGGGQGGSSVSVGDQMVIAEAGIQLLALRPQDGSVAWSLDFQHIVNGHTIVGNVVYVSTGGAGTVTALRLNDGVRLWQTPLDWSEPWAPVAAGGVLYVSDDEGASAVPEPGKLYAIQTTDGAVAWKYDAGGGVPLPAVG